MSIALLKHSAIQHYLQSELLNEPIRIHVMDSIDSTNRFLKDLPQSHSIEVCCAEAQTDGRGRFGRQWHSPFGKNIYFSLRWHIKGELSQQSGMSLVVSMAVLAALQDMNINDVRIKWPNDLVWQGQKLCGSLIEALLDRTTGADVIIGIGLNVSSSVDELALLNRPSCSLYDITGVHFDRNVIIARLITRLIQHLERFSNQGFLPFLPVWQQTDDVYGKMIHVTQPTGSLSGIAKGVNEGGQLILIDESGKTHYLSSGETSFQKRTTHFD